MTGGSMNRSSGNLLNRGYRLGKLKNEINDLTEIQRKLEREKKDIQLKQEENIKQLAQYEELLQSLNIEIVKLENQKNNIANQMKNANDSIFKCKEEISKLNQELKDIEQEKEDLKSKSNIYEIENQNIKSNIEILMEQFESIKEIKEMLVKEVTDLNIQINLLENKLLNKEEKKM